MLDGLLERSREQFVEAAAVEQAGELVAPAELAQLGTGARVLDRDRRRIGEPLGELEVETRERRTVTLAVKAHRADHDAACDERAPR